jgi:hypothetical protein
MLGAGRIDNVNGQGRKIQEEWGQYGFPLSDKLTGMVAMSAAVSRSCGSKLKPQLARRTC